MVTGGKKKLNIVVNVLSSNRYRSRKRVFISYTTAASINRNVRVKKPKLDKIFFITATLYCFAFLKKK